MLGYEIFIGDIDLKEAGMNYYDLPKEKRWLGGDSPYQIGGRATDVSQIAYSLMGRVKEMYSINAVPKKLEDELKKLTDQCGACEKAIESMISLITEYKVG